MADERNSPEIAGPRNPKAALKIVNPERNGLYLGAVGGDGTLYVTASNMLWAIRDHKLLWGFEGRPLFPGDMRTARDGRIWCDPGYCSIIAASSD